MGDGDRGIALDLAGVYKKYDTFILGAVGILGVGLLWEIASRLQWMDPVLISSPSRVAIALYDWAASGLLWRDLGTSRRYLGHIADIA